MLESERVVARCSWCSWDLKVYFIEICRDQQWNQRFFRASLVLDIYNGDNYNDQQWTNYQAVYQLFWIPMSRCTSDHQLVAAHIFELAGFWSSTGLEESIVRTWDHRSGLSLQSQKVRLSYEKYHRWLSNIGVCTSCTDWFSVDNHNP